MGFVNEAMQAGTAYEHRILDFLQIPGLVMDKQVITGHLRINLDGCTDDTIYEVKTYRLDKVFTPPLSYVRQVNVEMFGLGVRKAYIVAYGLTEREYNNFYCDIDIDRLSFHPIEYDPKFIEEIYIPRLNYLSECLDTGAFPKVW